MFRVMCAFASFELISGGITSRREMHVVFRKNKCGHWRIKKREKRIDQGEEYTTVWMKENEKRGGAFLLGNSSEIISQISFFFYHLFFLSLNLFCFLRIGFISFPQ